MPTDETAENVTCDTCQALCCRMQVLLFDDPGVPEELVAQGPWGGAVMRREADGWCAAADRNTMRCTIYADRPQVCRDFELGGSDCLSERQRLKGDSVNFTDQLFPSGGQ